MVHFCTWRRRLVSQLVHRKTLVLVHTVYMRWCRLRSRRVVCSVYTEPEDLRHPDSGHGERPL